MPFSMSQALCRSSRSASTRCRACSTRPRPSRGGEESRRRGAARLAARARHVRARPPGAGRLRPGQERRRAAGRRRAAEIRGQRNHPRPAQAAHRQDRGLPQDARCQGDRRFSRSRDHLPARAEQGPDARAATTSITSCCRTSISISPRPTPSCAIAAWRSASATSWATFRSSGPESGPRRRRRKKPPAGFPARRLNRARIVYFSRLAASFTRLRSAYFSMSSFFFTKPSSRVTSTLRCNASRFGMRFGS